MTDYKSPYRELGMNATRAVNGRLSDKEKKARKNKIKSGLPSFKEIAAAKLREFDDYSTDFADDYETIQRTKRKRKGT